MTPEKAILRGHAAKPSKLVAGHRVYSSSGHGFTNPSNLSEEPADRQYKAAIQRLFKEIFGS